MPASETTISANLLKVSDLESSDVADRVRERYEAEFGEPPEQPGGWYRPADWKRTSFVLERLRPGGKLLDVGTGAGQFANMLASTEQWDSVTALDHTRFGKYREYFDRMERTDASIVKLPLGDVFLPGIADCGAPMMFESDTTRYERRIAQLEAEVERLSSRKAIKIANTFGRALRTIDWRVRSLRPGR